MTDPAAIISLILMLMSISLLTYHDWLRKLRRDIVADIHRKCGLIREIRKTILDLRLQYQDFEPYKHDPYIQHILNLKRLLSTLAIQYTNILKEQKEILQHLPFVYPNHIKQFLKFIVYGKNDWERIRLKEGNINNHLDEASSQISKVENLLAELGSQPQKALMRIEKIKKVALQIQSGIKKLEEKRVTGETFKEGVEQYKFIDENIKKIPANYYIGIGNDFHAVVTATIYVTLLLDGIENSCNLLLENVNSWNSLVRDSATALSKAENLLSDIEKSVKSMSTSVDLTEMLAQVRTTTLERFFILRQKVKEPQLEYIQKLIWQINQISEEYGSQYRAFGEINDQFEKFNQLFQTFFTRVQDLQAGFNSQANQSKYPIIWDISHEKIEPLISEWEAIESPRKKRLPIEISKDLDRITSIDKRLIELEETCKLVISHAKELREGRAAIRKITIPDWLDKVNELRGKIKLFSLENWDSKLGAGTMIENAQKLVQQAEQSIPSGRILESRLQSDLHIQQILINDISTFQENQAAIEAKYRSLIEKDHVADQKIKITLPWVHAIINEVNRWNLPTNLVKSIYEVDNKGELLKTELNNRNEGQVDEKFQKIEKWAKDANDAIFNLVETLSSDIKLIQENVISILNDIDKIGRIRDRSVDAARELVVVPIYRMETLDANLNTDQPYEKIRSLLQRRHDLESNRNELEEAVKLLIDNYEEVIRYRESALTLLEKARTQMTRRWPPVHEETNTQREKQAADDIEDDMNFYRKNRQTISTLEMHYLSIRDKYKSIILETNEKIRMDLAQYEHYSHLENNLKSRLRTRIQEQVSLIPDFVLSIEQYKVLEQRGLSLVKEIVANYENNIIDAREVESQLANIFLAHNTKIDLRTLNIVITEGGPAFLGNVNNTGQIGGTVVSRIN